MVELQNLCEEIVEDVEGSLGCAAIDLGTGDTLAAVCRADAVLNSSGMDLISVAVSEMFHGKLIRQFHRAWSGGQPNLERFVREVQMATANSHQFMSVVPGWDDCLLVFITDKTVSRGLVWMSVHQGLARIAAIARAEKPSTDSRTSIGSAPGPFEEACLDLRTAALSPPLPAQAQLAGEVSANPEPARPIQGRPAREASGTGAPRPAPIAGPTEVAGDLPTRPESKQPTQTQERGGSLGAPRPDVRCHAMATVASILPRGLAGVRRSSFVDRSSLRPRPNVQLN